MKLTITDIIEDFLNKQVVGHYITCKDWTTPRLVKQVIKQDKEDYVYYFGLVSSDNETVWLRIYDEFEIAPNPNAPNTVCQRAVDFAQSLPAENLKGK